MSGLSESQLASLELAKKAAHEDTRTTEFKRNRCGWRILSICEWIESLNTAGKERDKRLRALERKAPYVMHKEEIIGESSQPPPDDDSAICEECGDPIPKDEDIIWVEKMPYCRRCSSRKGLIVCDETNIPHRIRTSQDRDVLAHLEVACGNPRPAPEDDPLPALALKFTKHYGGMVVCDRFTAAGMRCPPHEQTPACINSRPAESLTLEVVLGVLEANGYFWEMHDELAPREYFALVGKRGDKNTHRVVKHPNLKVALLRAWEKAVEGEKA